MGEKPGTRVFKKSSPNCKPLAAEAAQPEPATGLGGAGLGPQARPQRRRPKASHVPVALLGANPSSPCTWAKGTS
ncbi:ARRB2 isoform 12 [Pongo abelii]|uniref:ARRB2 isoform 12 n=1 Tax=Pongo abelii TaxID=9601 RepID=A0A2J8SPL8_PONAB|nr:ARRB2 isoform 12 [Pongo abelii]